MSRETLPPIEVRLHIEDILIMHESGQTLTQIIARLEACYGHPVHRDKIKRFIREEGPTGLLDEMNERTTKRHEEWLSWSGGRRGNAREY